MNWNRTTPTENPEPGSYIGRCISIIDLGTQPHSFNGETWSSRDVRIGFELPTTKMEGTYNDKLKGRPFGVNMRLKQSLHPSSRMRKLLRSWRGRDFTKEDVSAFDPKKMIGAPCRLTLTQSADGQYVNIEGIAPLGKGEKCPKQINPSLYFSLDPGEFDVKVFSTLGEKTREMITNSPEYRALTQETEPDGDHGPEAGIEPTLDEPADDDQPF